MFLASMFLVQLIKNAVSFLFHIPTRNVVLFVFGDSILVPENETSPRFEAMRAVITISLTLLTAAALQWIYTYWSSSSESWVVLILQWMAFFWYMLAILHLVPAFPLANGRLLSSIAWKVTGKYLRAVLMATRVGWLFGSCLLLWGLYLLFFPGQTTSGLLLIFFGWFMQGAASLSSRRAVLLDSLKYARAKDVMRNDYATISPSVLVGELTGMMRIRGEDYFPVVEEGRLIGVVTAPNIKRLPRKLWEATPVRSIMTPTANIKTSSAEATAPHILEQMDQYDIEDIPVLENGRLVGIAVRNNLERLAAIRALLKI